MIPNISIQNPYYNYPDDINELKELKELVKDGAASISARVYALEKLFPEFKKYIEKRDTRKFIYFGFFEEVKLLVEAGADVNYEEPEGLTVFPSEATPLFVAIENNKEDIMKFLIHKGADVNKTDKRKFFTPLSLAVSRKKLWALELLLKHGADSNQEDRFGLTPLRYTYKGMNGSDGWSSLYQKMADLLIKYGAKV